MVGMQYVFGEFWEKVLKKCQGLDFEDVYDLKGLKYLKLESDLFKFLFYGRTWGRDQTGCGLDGEIYRRNSGEKR